MKAKHDEGKHVSKTRRNTAKNKIWACHTLHLKCMFPDNEINWLIAATHCKMNKNTSNTTMSMKFRTWGGKNSATPGAECSIKRRGNLFRKNTFMVQMPSEKWHRSKMKQFYESCTLYPVYLLLPCCLRTATVTRTSDDVTMLVNVMRKWLIGFHYAKFRFDASFWRKLFVCFYTFLF